MTRTAFPRAGAGAIPESRRRHRGPLVQNLEGDKAIAGTPMQVPRRHIGCEHRR